MLNSTCTFLRDFTPAAVCFRMVLACVLGGLLGLNRERNRQAAGIRTYSAVCLGAATCILLSQYLYYMLNTQWAEISTAVGISTDVSRLGAQVINGIGFLGAGAILVTQKHHIRGLTTAAGLWACACMGLAVGVGFYELVMIGFLLLLISMVVLPLIDYRFETEHSRCGIRITAIDYRSLGGVLDAVRDMDLIVRDFHMEDDAKPHLDLQLELNKTFAYADLIEALSLLPQVAAVEKQ